jgi:hypothetical protein
MRRRLIIIVFVVVMLTSAGAAARNAVEKPREVDAGVFAIFVDGQQVASETFRIEQSATVSTISSEFKTEPSAGKSAFKSMLQIAPTGELKHYEWRETSPGKAQLMVDPAEGFLSEHVTPNPPDKPVQQALLLPTTTAVLDDYVFSHREVLAWRYLAQACNGSLSQCHPAKTDFGVLIPQQRSSMLVTIEYAGLEKVTIGNAERQLNRLNLKADDVSWSLWLDGNLKIVRILIPSEKTEVLRR